MRYSYNLDRKDIVFAHGKDINASFKDLAVVCDAIRYRNVSAALAILDGVINDGKPVEFRKYNTHMGSRHELGGRKGRYPMKCAAMVKTVIVNASANARNKSMNPEAMVIVHAAANKTLVAARTPPKGVRAVSTGGSGGYTTMRRSDLELAKIEIGISLPEKKELGSRMKRVISKIGKAPKNVEIKKDLKAQKRPQPAKTQKTPQLTPEKKQAVDEMTKKITEAIPEAKIIT